jgi:hypothetical protein
MRKKPQTWVDAYPHGTREGDEEQAFFIALGRHPKWKWRSVAAIVKESNLSKERVDELLEKYHKKGLVFQDESNPDQWAYWERVPELVNSDNDSPKQKDHKERMKFKP